MNYLVDPQLLPALARWIVSQGHQATHVFDIGLETADDPVIWERARSESIVITSKDKDFIDHWLLSQIRFTWFGFGEEIVRIGVACLARTVVARRCETVGAGRQVDRTSGLTFCTVPSR